MFAVGHMSIAYLLGKASSKPLKVNPNIPILLVLSILPDIDIIFQTITGATLHRGPTHSIIIALILFTPFFIHYRKRAIPYFLAYTSHFLGDFFIGGQLQLFWPLTTNNFGLHESGFMYIDIYSNINVAVELTMFTLALAVMAKTGDYRVFFRNDKTNLVLVIPIATVLLPAFIGYPFAEPLFLFLPLMGVAHLFFLIVFSISVLIVLYSIVKKALT